MGQPQEYKEKKILGKGLWSVVYDQGDDTVIKYTRAECAGIGNGVEKILHEIVCLQALEASRNKPFKVPRYIDNNLLNEGHDFYQDGYRICSITEKINGKSIDFQELRSFPSGRSDVIGRRLGFFLAGIHKHINDKSFLLPLDKSLISLRDDISPYLRPEDAPIRDHLDRLWHDDLPIMTQKVHGDFNISNILFDDNDKPIAVLDWAEACWGFPEWDIISIVGEIPNLAESMINAYEKEAEIKISQKNIEFAEKLRAVFSYLIGRRLDDEGHFLEARDRLRELGIAV